MNYKNSKNDINTNAKYYLDNIVEQRLIPGAAVLFCMHC